MTPISPTWAFQVREVEDGYEATFEPDSLSTYVGYGFTPGLAIIEVLWLAGELGNKRPLIPR